MPATEPRAVHLGLGSNLGDRPLNLIAALGRLAASVEVTAVSPLYETEPWGDVAAQPPFYNAACAVRSDLPLPELLVLAKRIEWELGRRPGLRWGPRPIDIDILLAGDEAVATLDLTVPHPHLAERGFVLAPLRDIAAERRHPLVGRTIADLYDALPPQERGAVRRIAGPEWAIGAVSETGTPGR